MRKGGVFSFINTFGLTISMATCLLIFQYALFELNYDHFHPNAGRTYRIIPIVFVVIVSLLAGMGQTLKVIAENPTKNLKHE